MPYSPIGIWEGSGDELVDLYHGTSRDAADSIAAHGIDVTHGDWNTDFGQGCYLMALYHQTSEWWAKSIVYGRQSAWWLDEENARPLPYP